MTTIGPPRVLKNRVRTVIEHDLVCEDCEDGKVEAVGTSRPPWDPLLVPCDTCHGTGVVSDDDCRCVECQSLAVVHGLLTEAEVTDEALALLRFWKRNGVSEAEVAL